MKRIAFLNLSKTTNDFHFSGEWSLMVQKAVFLLGGVEILHSLALFLPTAQPGSFQSFHGTLAWSRSDKAASWQQQEEKRKRIQRKDKFDINITWVKGFWWQDNVLVPQWQDMGSGKSLSKEKDREDMLKESSGNCEPPRKIHLPGQNLKLPKACKFPKPGIYICFSLLWN